MRARSRRRGDGVLQVGIVKPAGPCAAAAMCSSKRRLRPMQRKSNEAQMRHPDRLSPQTHSPSELAACKDTRKHPDPRRSAVWVSFGSMLVKRDQWDSYRGPKKVIIESRCRGGARYTSEYRLGSGLKQSTSLRDLRDRSPGAGSVTKKLAVLTPPEGPRDVHGVRHDKNADGEGPPSHDEAVHIHIVRRRRAY